MYNKLGSTPGFAHCKSQAELQNQCCGSVTFWYGSGSGRPYPSLTVSVIGSSLVREWLTRCQKTKVFFSSFFVEHFLKVKKSKKKSQRSRKEIKVLNFFFLLMEGSGSVQIITDPRGPKRYRSYGSGSTTLASTLDPHTTKTEPSPWNHIYLTATMQNKMPAFMFIPDPEFFLGSRVQIFKIYNFLDRYRKIFFESIDTELNFNLSIYKSKNF